MRVVTVAFWHEHITNDTTHSLASPGGICIGTDAFRRAGGKAAWHAPHCWPRAEVLLDAVERRKLVVEDLQLGHVLLPDQVGEASLVDREAVVQVVEDKRFGIAWRLACMKKAVAELRRVVLEHLGCGLLPLLDRRDAKRGALVGQVVDRVGKLDRRPIGDLNQLILLGIDDKLAAEGREVLARWDMCRS